MDNLDLLLCNATVTHFSNARLKSEVLNLGIKKGKIAYLGNDLPPATSTRDLRSLNIIPGVIDTQVHFREPGLTHKEDLSTGSKSCLLGGVTSYFEMPNTLPPTISAESLSEKIKIAESKSFTNFAFYIGGCKENVKDTASLEALRYTPGIKTFIGSSTGTLLMEDDSTIEQLFKLSTKRLVFHSEDEQRLRDRKHIATDSGDVIQHNHWRDAESCLMATRKLIQFAIKFKKPIHILHVTTFQEIELLQNTKKTYPGLVTFEILPQHLTLHAPECYETLGTKAQQNPPIREVFHQQALWSSIENGTCDILGSDHAPHTLEEKSKPYPNSPSGMPMAQTFVPIMLDHINKGRLSLERYVELVCENPRKIFGIQNKGRIAVGEDADLTVIDLKKTVTITNEMMATKCEWTPFAGKTVQGWPVEVFIDGSLKMKDGAVLTAPSGKPLEFVSQN